MESINISKSQFHLRKRPQHQTRRFTLRGDWLSVDAGLTPLVEARPLRWRPRTSTRLLIGARFDLIPRVSFHPLVACFLRFYLPIHLFFKWNDIPAPCDHPRHIFVSIHQLTSKKKHSPTCCKKAGGPVASCFSLPFKAISFSSASTCLYIIFTLLFFSRSATSRRNKRHGEL